MKPPIPTVGATNTTPHEPSDASSDALRWARVGRELEGVPRIELSFGPTYFVLYQNPDGDGWKVVHHGPGTDAICPTLLAALEAALGLGEGEDG